ncbi:MAG: protein TolQ [Syntrophales bacterium]|nr:protein TolQ [Syntrophales bacterium]
MKDISSVDVLDPTGNFHGSLLSMILDAGGMVQFVLLLLLFFSIVSWAIILTKYGTLRKIKRENGIFLARYMKSGKLSEIFPETKRFKYSTVAGVFQAGYAELSKLTRTFKGSETGRGDDDAGLTGMPLSGIDNIERAMNRACETEVAKLESTLGFLATTGSASPFIGLFGTVWGIMHTFKGIGAKGSATLAIVAPGISEALIATAAGLAVAIPAVIFYNYYLNRVKTMTVEMESFSSELLNIIERHYLR